MKNIPAYFDGNAVRTVEDYPFRKNQRLVITVLDDFAEERRTEKRMALDELHGIFGTMTHEEAEDIRRNRVNFTERF